MSSESESSVQPGRPSSASLPWRDAKALWAGLSIVTMWLVVLFVGLFGGAIVSSTPGGTSTSVPVVVVMCPFVLPATVVVARRGFRGSPGQLQAPPSEEPAVRERPVAEPPTLRAKPA